MKKKISFNSGANIAFIGKDGTPIPYGAFVKFKLKDSEFEQVGRISKFNNGSLAFQDITELLYGKWRANFADEVDFSTVEALESIPLGYFTDFIDEAEEMRPKKAKDWETFFGLLRDNLKPTKGEA